MNMQIKTNERNQKRVRKGYPFQLLRVGFLTIVFSSCSGVQILNFAEDKIILQETAGFQDPTLAENKAKEICSNYNRKAVLIEKTCYDGSTLFMPKCAKRLSFSCISKDSNEK